MITAQQQKAKDKEEIDLLKKEGKQYPIYKYIKIGGFKAYYTKIEAEKILKEMEGKGEIGFIKSYGLRNEEGFEVYKRIVGVYWKD